MLRQFEVESVVAPELEGELKFWIDGVLNIGRVVKCKERFIGATLSGKDVILD